MTSEWDEKLAKVADKLIAWLESAERLVTEQTPLVLKEILQYAFWESILVIIVWCLCTSFFLLMLAHRVYYPATKSVEWRQDYEDILITENIAITLGLIACGITFFSLTLSAIFQLIKITTAPRLYLLEYLGRSM